MFVLPGLALLAVFFVYPGVQILIRSVSEFTPPETGGLDNFTWFFESGTNVTILIRTLTTAFLVTAVCLLVGYPYAYAMTIVGRRVRMVLLAALIIAEFSSLLVRSYSWVILLQANGPINDVLAALGLGRVDALRNHHGRGHRDGSDLRPADDPPALREHAGHRPPAVGSGAVPRSVTVQRVPAGVLPALAAGHSGRVAAGLRAHARLLHHADPGRLTGERARLPARGDAGRAAARLRPRGSHVRDPAGDHAPAGGPRRVRLAPASRPGQRPRRGWARRGCRMAPAGAGAACRHRRVRSRMDDRPRARRDPDQLRRRGVTRVSARLLVDALVFQLLHQPGVDGRHVGNHQDRRDDDGHRHRRRDGGRLRPRPRALSREGRGQCADPLADDRAAGRDRDRDLLRLPGLARGGHHARLGGRAHRSCSALCRRHGRRQPAGLRHSPGGRGRQPGRGPTGRLSGM